MPSKNLKRSYIANAVFHVLNRGVNKRRIFIGKNDYETYLRYLNEYLLPKEDSINAIQSNENLQPLTKIRYLQSISSLKNFTGRINVLSFALMPNHIHLELHQSDPHSISEFIHAIHTRYAGYFNKKYHRVGTLFQERFKNTYCADTRGILNVARYIHQNPKPICDDITEYPWSSLKYYKSNSSPKWLDMTALNAYFEKSYERFEYRKLLDFMKGPAF